MEPPNNPAAQPRNTDQRPPAPRTPSGETDWEALYLAGDTQWDKGEPSPGLVDFLQANPDLPKLSVAIPGCGTGHDVRAWAKAGFIAHGFDLAPSAVRLCQEKTAAAALQASFALADFLRDEPPQPFDWLFEHTLFCAIKPDRRDEYVAAACRWLKPNGYLLAVHYMISDTDGPPFGTDRAEILQRFSPHFELIEEWVPRSYPNRTNLEWMLWWRKRT